MQGVPGNSGFLGIGTVGLENTDQRNYDGSQEDWLFGGRLGQTQDKTTFTAPIGK